MRGMSKNAKNTDEQGKVHAQLKQETEQAAAVPQKAHGRLKEPAAPPASSAAVRKSMQGNKATDTKPELKLRKMLRDMGQVGYRLQWKKCPGRPDVAFPGRRIAIYVNGCFWHRCPKCNLPEPKSNVEYWHTKFANNVARDRRNLEAAREQGWKTVVVWECELKKKQVCYTQDRLYREVAGPKAPDAALARIKKRRRHR